MFESENICPTAFIETYGLDAGAGGGWILPRDCSGLYTSGYEESGVYTIYMYNAGQPTPFSVYCDMETDGGGWMVCDHF